MYDNVTLTKSISDFISNKYLPTIKQPMVFLMAFGISNFERFLNVEKAQEFIVLGILMLFVQILDFLFAIFKCIMLKQRFLSHKMGDTVNKLFTSIFLFLTVSICTIFTKEINYLIYFTTNFVTVSIVCIVISREVLSMFETAEELGFKIPNFIKEKIMRLENINEEDIKNNNVKKK